MAFFQHYCCLHISFDIEAITFDAAIVDNLNIVSFQRYYYDSNYVISLQSYQNLLVFSVPLSICRKLNLTLVEKMILEMMKVISFPHIVVVLYEFIVDFITEFEFEFEAKAEVEVEVEFISLLHKLQVVIAIYHQKQMDQRCQVLANFS